MNLRLNILLLLSLLVVNLFSQEAETKKKWTTGGKIGANLSEVGFYNWSKGGDNSMAGTSFLQAFANRDTNGWAWENKLDLEFGIKQNQNEILKKTDDRIELNSKLGRQINQHLYFTAFLNFKTQFTEGFDYEKSDVYYTSNIMAPGYLTIGLGLDYKPNEYFSALIAPLSSKTTIVLDERLADAGSFGVKAAEYDISGMKIKDGQTFREEIGANITISFKKDIFKNVNLDTKIDLFSNYLENPQNIDVDWQTTITMKVNKYLNAVFKTHLIYDDNTNINWEKDGISHLSPITQFKQSLAVGLMYEF
ncbi:MAG: DUF3078 domain-containing protein [Bacteroidales bacterium]|nr:DUF3078 domain-containing protein [Bacteroidales bacterium]